MSRPIADILVGEHPDQLLFLRIVEAAGVNPFPGVLVGPEQHVPPGDVAVVVLVAVVLVMDAMHLGALEDEPDPARRLDVRVIEELAECRAQRVDRTCFKRQAEEGVHEQTADDRIDDHFARALVEGGNDLEPPRAVVDLVEAAPQKVVFMTPAVPPVEDKRGDEVSDQAADCGRHVLRKMEHRRRGQPALPAHPREQDDAELDGVDQQHPQRPGTHLRQWPAGNDALKNEAEDECRDDGG